MQFSSKDTVCQCQSDFLPFLFSTLNHVSMQRILRHFHNWMPRCYDCKNKLASSFLHHTGQLVWGVCADRFTLCHTCTFHKLTETFRVCDVAPSTIWPGSLLAWIALLGSVITVLIMFHLWVILFTFEWSQNHLQMLLQVFQGWSGATISISISFLLGTVFTHTWLLQIINGQHLLMVKRI